MEGDCVCVCVCVVCVYVCVVCVCVYVCVCGVCVCLLRVCVSAKGVDCVLSHCACALNKPSIAKQTFPRIDLAS